MGNLSELSGYVASTLVLLTFVAKDMRLLRTTAIFSNLAFIAYGTIEWLPPVLFLHLVLLPLNIARLSEIVRSPKLRTTESNLTVQSVAKLFAPTYSARTTRQSRPGLASLTMPDNPVHTNQQAYLNGVDVGCCWF